MGIFPLQIIDMQRACQRVLMKIRQSQKRRKAHAAHAAHQRPLLGVEPVGPYTLVAHQMQRFILIRIIGLLKYRHVVCAAFMKIPVFIGIDRINLQPHHPEILLCQLAGLADVIDAALSTALTGQNQDLLHTTVGDNLHFFLYLLHIELHAVNVVIAVEATVYTVIFAVIGDIKGRKQIHRIAKMLTGLPSGPLRHLLQEGFRRRR